jgi:CRISPR-associated exonuclease Cas4
MEKYYSDDDFLLLSGIQHMAFCERQWALIHIEQAWAENVLTLDGKHLHERTDNPFEDETRKDIRIVRAMPIISKNLDFVVSLMWLNSKELKRRLMGLQFV